MDPTLGQYGPSRLGLHELRTARARHVFDELVPWLDSLVRAWEIYIHSGGLPISAASALDGQGTPARFVNDLFNIAFRRAFANSQFSEAQTWALLGRLAEGLASPFNASKVAAELSVTSDTIASRIDDLRESYLLWPCRLMSEQDFVARPGSQSKLYMTDPLIARLAHLRNPSFNDPDITKLTENQLGMALVRRLEEDSPGTWPDFAPVFYVRTKARKEIDFVARLLNGVAIEAKFTQRGTWAREAATVNASPFRGLLATRNVLDMSSKGDDAWAVPASILAYALDT